MTGESLSSMQVAIENPIHWLVRSSSKKEGHGMGGGRMLEGIVIQAHCKFHFIKDHEILV